MNAKTWLWLLSFCLLLSSPAGQASAMTAIPQTPDKKQLFDTIESVTQVPWYILAAIDQYESNLRRLDKKTTKTNTNRRTAITIPPMLWSGALNPEADDQTPFTIQLFHGIGQDGDGDHRANRQSDVDSLYALGTYLVQKGITEDAIREQLWLYYEHSTTVDIITHIAKIFHTQNRLNLDAKHFPIPTQYVYTYRSTWGAKRGWGGARMHEGTDLFASYGTPVLSTCYGYIELLGWNRYGGWRIGIRDVNNNYHYFAHLNGFAKGLRQGMVVKPGQPLGSVGSSGYGPPGTAGKFPPHLHYGIYKFNGKKTYAIDPYPALRRWEKALKKKQEAH